MKVLHAIHPFLQISENWIYPQVMQVPGVEPGVLTSARYNEKEFPADGAFFVYDPPRWRDGAGIPRLVNSLSFRMGRRGVSASAVLKRWAPAIIHAHFGMAGWDMMRASEELGIPLIVSFYGIDAWRVPQADPRWAARFHELFARGAAFIAEGPAMGRRMLEIGCPPDKLHICRIGVDEAKIPFRPATAAASLRVAMMARFVRKKGFEDGLEACAKAAANGVPIEVTIIGGGMDEGGHRIERKLREIAATPSLKGKVHFAGFLPPPKAKEALASHDLFLVPSRHAPDGDAEGGSPVGLTEAMALGLLCVGTRHCDIPEIIRDGETGLLCDSGDTEAMAASLERAADSPDRMAPLRRAGRALVEDLFTTNRQVRDLRSIYDAVCGHTAEAGEARC